MRRFSANGAIQPSPGQRPGSTSTRSISPERAIQDRALGIGGRVLVGRVVLDVVLDTHQLPGCGSGHPSTARPEPVLDTQRIGRESGHPSNAQCQMGAPIQHAANLWVSPNTWVSPRTPGCPRTPSPNTARTPEHTCGLWLRSGCGAGGPRIWTPIKRPVPDGSTLSARGQFMGVPEHPAVPEHRLWRRLLSLPWPV